MPLVGTSPSSLTDRLLLKLADGLIDIPDWHHLVKRRILHEQQIAFVESQAKRKVIRAGRRGGKTVGVAALGVDGFMAGRRILYATPTQEQVDRFWFEVKDALHEAIQGQYLYKNETRHIIEVPGTQNRIRAKTAWNADSLRGDYADLLIFDEWQLMDEGAWGDVGAPMLMDNVGDAIFVYTPPSARSRSVSKARDPRHAAKLFKAAQADTSGLWAAFHFSSMDNPFLRQEGLDLIIRDMTRDSYEREILALDKDDIPGALLTHAIFEASRVNEYPDLHRIAVAVDPAGSNTADSDETGIVVTGIAYFMGELHGYTLEDLTLRGSPEQWARQAVSAYHKWEADILLAEKNNGGDMVEHTIRTVDSQVNIKLIHASRGKHTRAEPIAALYEQEKIHHVGYLPELEDQWCGWIPGVGDSPDRLDAEVWGYTELMLESGSSVSSSPNAKLYPRRKVPT